MSQKMSTINCLNGFIGELGFFVLLLAVAETAAVDYCGRNIKGSDVEGARCFIEDREVNSLYKFIYGIDGIPMEFVRRHSKCEL